MEKCLFDTVILGHVGELSAICKRNFLEEIMNNCIKNGKKLFAFDDLSEYASKFANQEKFNECCYFPEVTYQNIPKGRFGKLFGIQMPVLGIVGTSSSQGKLTIQMELRRKLMEQGYNVGQIGTEPTAFCYDMDFVYPYGYKSTVKTVGYHNVLLLNNIIHDIEMKDVIFVLWEHKLILPHTHMLILKIYLCFKRIFYMELCRILFFLLLMYMMKQNT